MSKKCLKKIKPGDIIHYNGNISGIDLSIRTFGTVLPYFDPKWILIGKEKLENGWDCPSAFLDKKDQDFFKNCDPRYKAFMFFNIEDINWNYSRVKGITKIIKK